MSTRSQDFDIFIKLYRLYLSKRCGSRYPLTDPNIRDKLLVAWRADQKKWGENALACTYPALLERLVASEWLYNHSHLSDVHKAWVLKPDYLFSKRTEWSDFENAMLAAPVHIHILLNDYFCGPKDDLMEHKLERAIQATVQAGLGKAPPAQDVLAHMHACGSIDDTNTWWADYRAPEELAKFQARIDALDYPTLAAR